MFSKLTGFFSTHKKLLWILCIGLMVQLITSINQTGFYHPDQHFQLDEFSSWQLHRPNGFDNVWESQHFVRPSLQVYIFSGFILACESVNLSDPYLQMTVLRVMMGLLCFFIFNVITIYFFKNKSAKTLLAAVFLLNFSWMFPYVRTLFSSEMLGAVLFFFALFLYDRRKAKQNDFTGLLFIGFLFSIAFYCRFQMGFSLAGLGVWMLAFERKYKKIIPLVIGFFIGFAINLCLDYNMYHEWIITPYRYFHVNINEGRATQFGTDSFLKYVGLLIAVTFAPLLSVALLFRAVQGSIKTFTANPFPVVIWAFVIAHCLVGHKEERFLFPVFNVLPLLIGWGIENRNSILHSSKKWLNLLIKMVYGFSLTLNFVLLFLFMFLPYSQTVYFSYLLKKKFEGNNATVYCLERTPLETESGAPTVFYASGCKNIHYIKSSSNDTLRSLSGKNILVVTTFNQIAKNKNLPDRLGYQPTLYSSKLLWNINEFLLSKKINTINDIWVMYEKK